LTARASQAERGLVEHDSGGDAATRPMNETTAANATAAGYP
jgi:hypothetical protein